MRRIFQHTIFPLLILSLTTLTDVHAAGVDGDRITLKVFSYALPDPAMNKPSAVATREIVRRFEELHPEVRVVSSTGLRIEGKTDEIVPLMQIAADISPDVIYVNFKNSDSYVQQGFLYPLDEFLSQMPKEELDSRVPPPAWPVIRRPGRDGTTHVWALPYDTSVMALTYSRSLFRAAGLDVGHAPRNWVELEEYGRRIHDANPDKYGIAFQTGGDESWLFLSFLWSAGAEPVVEIAPNEWRAAFDSPQAVEAFYFYYKLVREGAAYRGPDCADRGRRDEIAMSFNYVNDKQLANIDPAAYGLAPVPAGPAGLRGNEVNCRMMGIYAGQKDPRKRQAAWEFIRFYDSREARQIRTRVYVENGLARNLNPQYLREFGYEEYLKDVPREWVKTFDEAIASGKPEPYGKNSNLIYKEMSRPISQMFLDTEVAKRWAAGDETGVKTRIQEILRRAVRETNERMIGFVSPEVRRIRLRVAAAVVAVVAASFFFLFRYVWRVFTPTTLAGPRGGWQFGRYWFAYLILLPAVATILVWQYIPLARGSLMAFQDYRIMGGSIWRGLDNFATVLFDPNFWNALWVTLQYAFWSLTLGFFAPVILAVMLQEIPRGKVFFRIIYYLPAVVSGLIVIFLWRSFYVSDGLLNQLLHWIGIESHRNWVDDPRCALLACVIPTIWAGTGPGCLIYLAALKTIPDELYEAADLDGASFVKKFTHIVVPSLKSLLIINFVGAFAASFHTAQFIFVMTGGGPYNPYGATEVTSLLIYYNAFLYLKFGVATTMAWVLGSMLIGFTVIQLKRLANMEFRTTEAT